MKEMDLVSTFKIGLDDAVDGWTTTEKPTNSTHQHKGFPMEGQKKQ